MKYSSVLPCHSRNLLPIHGDAHHLINILQLSVLQSLQKYGKQSLEPTYALLVMKLGDSGFGGQTSVNDRL